MHLKANLARLEMDYHKGVIDTDTYVKKQSEILQELDNMSTQKNTSQGDTSIDL